MTITAIAYIRPSHGHPLDAAAQEQAIREHAARLGITILRFFRDDGRHRLRARDVLLRTLSSGASIVLVTSACRLSPDMPGLIKVLAAIREAGARVIVASNDPAASVTLGALIAGLPALIAVREGMHREKAAAGRERARARGVRLGRPPVSAEKVSAAKSMLASGVGVRPTARRLGIGVASVARIKQSVEAVAGGP